MQNPIKQFIEESEKQVDSLIPPTSIAGLLNKDIKNLILSQQLALVEYIKGMIESKRNKLLPMNAYLGLDPQKMYEYGLVEGKLDFADKILQDLSKLGTNK